MFSKHFECMGTVFIFQVADDVDHKVISQDVEKACSVLVEADNRFSLYKPESEVSLLNSGKLDWDKASPVQKDIREKVLLWSRITAGYFDSVSSEGVYDPSGLVKTWAAANAGIYLEANGYRDFTINAGGDVYLGPEVKTQPLTRVGLANLKPISSKDAAVNMVLDLKGTDYRAVATSGTAERGDHIWRKTDSLQESPVIQATVVAKDLVTADVWATALISGGAKALDRFESTLNPDEAVAVMTFDNGRITASAGFSKVLADLS